MSRTLEPSIRQFVAGAVGMAFFLFLAAGVLWLARTTQPWSLLQTAATIVLCVAAAWSVLAWVSGYRRATPTEVEAVMSRPCWHATTRDLPADGLVLDPARTRRLSRMLFARAPWRRPIPAVYVFTRPPDQFDRRFNISDDKVAHQVHIEKLEGPLYIRRDGAVAIPTRIRIVPEPSEPVTEMS